MKDVGNKSDKETRCRRCCHRRVGVKLRDNLTSAYNITVTKVIQWHEGGPILHLGIFAE